MIAERDGVHVGDVVCDARRAEGAVNVVSHAHSDHLPRVDHGRVAASEVTVRLAAARNGVDLEPVDAENVELLPSGHIAGSRAARIETGGRTVLYTGDVCTRDRLYLDGFEPVGADVLVMEATYGVPAYEFPRFEAVERRVLDWIERHPDRPLVLAAYSLGKAQKVQAMVEGCGRRVLAHERVAEMNSVVAEAADPGFGAEPLGGAGELHDELVVVPPRVASGEWADAMRREHGALAAGFTGWAVAGRDRGRYDTSFPVSDHCDFPALVDLVERVDPDTVYTHHGFDAAFAAFLRREKGIDARALGSEQATLHEF